MQQRTEYGGILACLNCRLHRFKKAGGSLILVVIMKDIKVCH